MVTINVYFVVVFLLHVLCVSVWYAASVSVQCWVVVWIRKRGSRGWLCGLAQAAVSSCYGLFCVCPLKTSLSALNCGLIKNLLKYQQKRDRNMELKL